MTTALELLRFYGALPAICAVVMATLYLTETKQ